MGSVFFPAFLAMIVLTILQLFIFNAFNKSTSINIQQPKLNFKNLLDYWDNNLGILFVFGLILILAEASISLGIVYLLLCSVYYYSESTKIRLKVDGVYKDIIYPLSWYIKDGVSLTLAYITSLTFIKIIKDNVLDLFKKLKSLILTSWNDILVGLFIKEPRVGDHHQIYQRFYEFQKKFFKYKKPIDLNAKTANKDEDEATRAKRQKRIRDNNDPRIMLNRLRRLPIWIKYNPQFGNSSQKFLQHILVVYNFLKSTLVALFFMILYFIFTIFFFKLQFLKQLAVWFIVGMLFFWLISGFNFFLKRYQFGKFTSAIQRFWKRTNTCFWLIEGFLILLFFYYYLNSSQEPVYMYDYSSLNQEYLISLQTAGLNVIILSLIIYFMYFTLLRITSNSWVQLNLYVLLISIFIFFSFFIETYQFYYVISTFNERLWVFNEEENLWSIDVENPILRNKHQYLLMCLIAKYWHFLFIFLSWVFFLIKSFERRKYTYVLFGVNLQNMVLLYVLNFACYLQWFKWFSRRFLDLPYTWFMTNIDSKLIFRLYAEIRLLLSSFFIFNNDTYLVKNLFYKSLNFWAVDSLTLWKFI